MADNYSQFLGVFLGEAAENLEALEGGLLELESRPGDASLLNAIFRAAHTIKGSAGLVGQKGIQDFTHILENLLDRVRSGQVAADGAVISTVLASADVIKRMVGNLSAGRSAEAELDLDRAFARLRSHDPQANEASAAHGGAGAPSADAPRLHRYHLSLKYGPGVLLSGIDPLMFLEDLEQAGTILALEDDPTGLPAWDAFDPEAWALGWKLLFESKQPIERLKEIFLFVSDDSEIRITELTDDVNAAKRDALAAWAVGGKNPADLAAPDRREGSDRRSPEDRRGPLDRRTGLPAVGAPMESAEPATAGASSVAEKTIRVDTEKLDKLLNMVSELVIAQSQITMLAREITGGGGARLRDISADIEKLSRQLQEHTMQLRMVHLGPVFYPFRRLVRDQGVLTGKQVRLVIEGEETELDKTLIAKISDPLKHLVRNAIDHGLETGEARLAAGKSEIGTVTLRAYTQGRNVVIEVIDDGAGLRKERILAKAVERGLVAAGAALTDDEIHRLIFHPGLSTAEKVSDLSGRGVGMDVVISNVRELNGEVDILTQPGKGTTMRVRLPLTLAILDGMVVEVGDEQFILPITSIEETLRPTADQVATVEDRGELLNLRGQWIPFVRLGRTFSVASAGVDPQKALVVVIAHEQRRAGLLVDRLVDQTQVVLKSLAGSLQAMEGVSGATILGDGRVVLVLDPAGLLRLVFRKDGRIASDLA